MDHVQSKPASRWDGESQSPRGLQRHDAQRSKREYFIPLRKADLVRLLADEAELSERDRGRFLELCKLLESMFHFEYHQRLEELKELYAVFDPDRDTIPVNSTSKQACDELRPVLFDKFIVLLESANFRRLTRADVEDALRAASDWGVNLRVDFDVFERLEVFARGDAVGRETRRRCGRLYRLEEVEAPIYQRLVVIFQLREHPRLSSSADADTDSVYIKIFKNIPKMDLEMTLPGTRVRMTLLDRSRILLPTLSGVGITVFKIIQGAVVLAFASVYGVLAFLGLVGATIGYGVKSFFGYLRTKDKYQLSLTKSLYYQNLDNNAGVLFRLLDEAEEQECREAFLAYFLLWRKGPPEGLAESELDRQAEEFLKKTIEVDVDFEIGDALRKLQRLGLAVAGPGNFWRAAPVDESLVRLDHAWDRFFRHSAAEDR